QNIPGTIYNSESGFVIPQGTFGTFTGGVQTSITQIGLADYGTRLKAVFTNIPAGEHILVSTTNLTALTAATTVAPAGNSTNAYAVLVNGESTQDGNGTVPALAPTNSANGNTTALFDLFPLTTANGTATAVWEVINTNPAATETFAFGVWTSFTA